MDYTFQRKWVMTSTTTASGQWGVIWKLSTARHNTQFNYDQVRSGKNRFGGPYEELRDRYHEWIMKSLDPSLAVSSEDPRLATLKQNEQNLVVTPGDPTPEMIGLVMWSKLLTFMKSGSSDLRMLWIKDLTITLPETTVTITRDDYQMFRECRQIDERDWWYRPDLSTS